MGLTLTLTGGTSEERLLLALFVQQKLAGLGLQVPCPCFDDDPELRDELDHMLERRIPVRVRHAVTVVSGAKRLPRPVAKKPKGAISGKASVKARKR